MNPESSRQLELQEAQIQEYRRKQTSALVNQIESSCKNVVSAASLKRFSDQRPVFVVHVRGFLVDLPLVNDPIGGVRVVRNLTSIARLNGVEATGITTHRLQAQQACERILKTSKETRIFLIGHSMGAAGATEIASCLKKARREVEMMVHVSSHDDFEPTVDVTKVPDNVKSAYNFSVTDGMVDGKKNVTALNSETTQVHNSRHFMNLLIPFAGTHAYATSRLAQLISFIGGAKLIYPDVEVNVSPKLPFFFEKKFDSVVDCRLRSSENRQSMVSSRIYPSPSLR